MSLWVYFCVAGKGDAGMNRCIYCGNEYTQYKGRWQSSRSWSCAGCGSGSWVVFDNDHEHLFTTYKGSAFLKERGKFAIVTKCPVGCLFVVGERG